MHFWVCQSQVFFKLYILNYKRLSNVTASHFLLLFDLYMALATITSPSAHCALPLTLLPSISSGDSTPCTASRNSCIWGTKAAL